MDDYIVTAATAQSYRYSQAIWLHSDSEKNSLFETASTLPELSFIVSSHFCLSSYRIIGVSQNLRIAQPSLDFYSPSTTAANYARLSRLLPPSAAFSGCICSLIHPANWHQYYYHWLIDILPRFFSAHDYHQITGDPVTLIVPHTTNQWQTDSLACINNLLPEARIKVSRSISFIHSSKVLFSPGSRLSSRSPFVDNIHDHPNGLLYPSLIRRLSDSICSSQALSRNFQSDLPKRFVISRSDANYRRIVNEDEIMLLLNDFNFERIELSRLSFCQQVQLFRSAEIVIAPHGAGLANIIFSTQATLLELHANNHGVRPDFYYLAGAVGCSYYAIVEKSINAMNDIRVSPSAIRSFLEHVL